MSATYRASSRHKRQKSPAYPLKSTTYPLKSPTYREEGCVHVRDITPLWCVTCLIHECGIQSSIEAEKKKEPCVYVKEPYISVKEPYVSAKFICVTWLNHTGRHQSRSESTQTCVFQQAAVCLRLKQAEWKIPGRHPQKKINQKRIRYIKLPAKLTPHRVTVESEIFFI